MGHSIQVGLIGAGAMGRVHAEILKEDAGARQAMLKLGPALCAEIKMNRGELENPPWTADAAVTGGFLFETPVHVFDLAQWLFGPAREVYARGGQKIYPQEDTFSVLLTF